MSEPKREDQAYVESHESEYLTPLEAVQTRARYDIMSHVDDFVAANIDPRYAELIAAKASDRAKIEFETKQDEDPLKQVEEILLSCALTEQDKLIATKNIDELEAHRSKWKAIIGAEKIRVESAGGTFNLEEVVKNLASYNRAPGFIEADIHSSAYYPHFYFISGVRGEAGVALPSKDYQEMVLHKLGALPESEKLEDLKLRPLDNQAQQKRGWPSYNSYTDKASHLPTNSLGVEVTVFMAEKSPMMSMGVDIKALQKILDLPSSI